ncbi:hypothetical protein B566_EDAN002603 [Ephemera danica]|nr:hypothetical protein B566_EDAN002603 [Ephemera danica]
MPLCGGISDGHKEATPEVQTLCDKVKEAVETKIGKPLQEFTAKVYKTQVVAGTNFFVKVHAGSDSFLHLRIYRDLKGTVSLHGVQEKKSVADELTYF